MKCYIIMGFIFFLITNEHLFICLSYSFSSSVILKLMSLAHIFIVIVVFSLLVFIHDGYCIFVGYMFCKYLFPVRDSLFSFMISFDKIRFLILYDHIYQWFLLCAFLYFKKFFPILKSFFFLEVLKLDSTFKSTIHQELLFVRGMK